MRYSQSPETHCAKPYLPPISSTDATLPIAHLTHDTSQHTARPQTTSRATPLFLRGADDSLKCTNAWRALRHYDALLLSQTPNKSESSAPTMATHAKRIHAESPAQDLQGHDSAQQQPC